VVGPVLVWSKLRVVVVGRARAHLAGGDLSFCCCLFFFDSRKNNGLVLNSGQRHGLQSTTFTSYFYKNIC
jgi:hypothetical protein